MKRFTMLLFVVMIVVGGAVESFAQVDEYVRRPHKVTIWLEAGLAIPSQPSDFKARWNTTWPFSGGVGFALFSWLELTGGLTYGSFGISEIPAKSSLNITSTAKIEGGSINMLSYYGGARVLAVPNQQINPFLEARVGVFKLTGDDLEVEPTSSGPTATPAIVRTLDDVNGIVFAFGGGLQYALNENWSAYTKFMWTLNLNGDFTPGELTAPDLNAEIEGGNMQFGTVTVGLLMRI